MRGFPGCCLFVFKKNLKKGKMRKIAESELIINSDGSVFHLHLKPEELAEKVILVGDPERVDMVARHFEERECEVRNREFHSVTGWFAGKRITCVSHGIGTDNIDIVMTELDALKNVDFARREVRAEFTPLELVRIGTSGGLQAECPIGSWVVARRSIGFDGLLNFYKNGEKVCDLEFEKAFKNFMKWDERLVAPYVVRADADLVARVGAGMVQGVTISAPGFYAPQGRFVRLEPKLENLVERVRAFRFGEEKIMNFEMESSALAGLAAMLGHRAMTVCLIIAGRVDRAMRTDYKSSMEDLVRTVLERI